MDIFSGRFIIGVTLLTNRTLKLQWSNGNETIHNSVTYTMSKDRNNYGENGIFVNNVFSGMIHLYQNGAANSMGFFGHWVSEDTPLSVNSIPFTNIEDLITYFKNNF